LGSILTDFSRDKVSSHINPINEGKSFNTICDIRNSSGKIVSFEIDVTPFLSDENLFAGISLKGHEASTENMENANSTDDLHLKLVKKNIKDITNTLELNPLLSIILQNSIEMIGADTGIVFLKKDKGLHLAAELPASEDRSDRLSFPLDKGITSEIISSYEHVFKKELNNDGSEISEFLINRGIMSVFFAPITLKGEFKGFLLLGWFKEHELERQESVLAQIVSVYFSFALLNAGLFDEKRKLAEELDLRFRRMPIGCITWTTDMKVESMNPEAEKIFGFTSHEAKESDILELILPEDDKEVFKKIHSTLLNGKETHQRETRNRTKDGRIIFCEWTSTPLRNNNGEIAGIISMVKDKSENKHLYSKLESKIEELSRKNHYEEAVRNISSGIHKSLNMQEIMESSVDLISTNIERANNVAIYSMEDNFAVLKSYRGYPEWFINKVRKIPYPKGFTWQTAIEKKARFVNDIENDKAIGQSGRDVGTRSYVSMPIMINQEVVGVLNINSYSEQAFSKEEINFLETMKNHLEIALNNAKSIETIIYNEERFISFMDNLPGAAFIKDLEGKYIYINEGFRKIFNIDINYAIGKQDEELWDPDTAAQFSRNDQKVQKDKKGLTTIEVTQINGKELSWFVNKFLLYDSDGNPKYIAGIAIDITDRLKAVEKTREQAALLDIASDAIMVVDNNNCIQYWNKSAELLYGWSAEEVRDQKPEDLFSLDTGTFQMALDTVKKTGEWRGELIHTTKDKGVINVDSRWTLVKDQESVPFAIFIVNTNISERKKTEKQLLQAQRLESIGVLAGGIAHDLNNVLQPILMSIQLLRSIVERTDKKHIEWIDILEESAKRGSGLVQQVLSFARGAEGEKTTLQLNNFIKEITKILRQTFPKSIDIKTYSPEDLWDISGDITKLHQVVMNLCINARDAMQDGGELILKLENLSLDENYSLGNIEAVPGPYVLITVSDNGTGIPEEYIDKLFDPFFTTKEPGKGTGLGLSTAFSIVKDHGGFIRVYSEVGAGSVFRVYLPAVKHPHIQKLRKNRKDEAIPLGKGETVLLVDDESSVLNITTLTLESNGYKVLTAGDGVEAVANYIKNMNSIDVVLMDMQMPVMGGVSSIRALNKINPDIRIVATSGYSDSRIALSGLSDIRIYDYLSKPYTSETLLRCLRKVLDT